MPRQEVGKVSRPYRVRENQDRKTAGKVPARPPCRQRMLRSDEAELPSMFADGASVRFFNVR